MTETSTTTNTTPKAIGVCVPVPTHLFDHLGGLAYEEIVMLLVITRRTWCVDFSRMKTSISQLAEATGTLVEVALHTVRSLVLKGLVREHTPKSIHALIDRRVILDDVEEPYDPFFREEESLYTLQFDNDWIDDPERPYA